MMSRFVILILLGCLVAVISAAPAADTTEIPEAVESPDDVEEDEQVEEPAAILKPNFWSECPNSWHNYEDNCYKWFGNERKETWFQAELDCRSEGGHLVSIVDKEESEILRGITMCTNEYWIGLVNTDYTEKLFLTKEGWKWWDGSSHNYTRMTYTNTVGLHCGFAKPSGDWTNNFCSHVKRGWVCKKPYNTAFNRVRRSVPTRIAPICPANWVFYNNSCYWFSNYTVNYFHAQLHCQDMNAHVTTVHSEQEQAFLQAINGCDEPFWIGLERAKPCLSEDDNSCWEWTDLSKVVYKNWKGGNPTKKDVNECTLSKGYWENNEACMKEHRFVCKRHRTE